MSANAQTHVAEILEKLTGATGYPGKVPAPLTFEDAWRLGRSRYTAVEVPTTGDRLAGRAVLAMVTSPRDGRCMAVVVTPAMVITRVVLPTVPQWLFKGTVLDGFLTQDTFVTADTVAYRGRRAYHLPLNVRRDMAAEVAGKVHEARDPGASPPHLVVVAAAWRPLDKLAELAAGTHLLVPDDRGFAPGRVQQDTFLASFKGLREVLQTVCE